jgi:hypothetical protein
MTKPPELSAALALAWSLLVTLALASVAVVTGLVFGASNLGLVAGALFEVALLLHVSRLLARLYGGPDRTRALATGAVAPLELGVAAALGVALQGPANYVSALVERRFPSPPSKLSAQLAQLVPESALLGVLMFAAVALLVPLAEELFFRGALFTALSRSGPAFVAIWTTSLAFTLAHLDPRTWAPLFLVALVLGWLRRVAGSIWPGVALHAAFNATTLGYVFWQKPVELEPAEASWPWAAGGGAFSLAASWLLARLASQRARGTAP